MFFFFFYIQKFQISIIKSTKKSSNTKHGKDIKICQKKKKRKGENYQNFTEEEKEKKSQYHCECNKNLSEEQKQKLVEHMRNHYLPHKK